MRSEELYDGNGVRRPLLGRIGPGQLPGFALQVSLAGALVEGNHSGPQRARSVVRRPCRGQSPSAAGTSPTPPDTRIRCWAPLPAAFGAEATHAAQAFRERTAVGRRADARLVPFDDPATGPVRRSAREKAPPGNTQTAGLSRSHSRAATCSICSGPSSPASATTSVSFDAQVTRTPSWWNGLANKPHSEEVKQSAG